MENGMATSKLCKYWPNSKRNFFLYITYYLGRTDTLITLPPVFDDMPEVDQAEAEYPSSFSTQFSILLARKTKQFCRNSVS